MNTLQVVAKEIYKVASKMQANGEMPLVLGVDGLIALVWDRLQRYMKRKEELELRDIAALTLLVCHASQAPELEELARETWDETPPPQEESASTLAFCPHCMERDKLCTIIPDAIVPICDDCVETFEKPEIYQEWAEDYLQSQSESSYDDDTK